MRNFLPNAQQQFRISDFEFATHPPTDPAGTPRFDASFSGRAPREDARHADVTMRTSSHREPGTSGQRAVLPPLLR